MAKKGLIMLVLAVVIAGGVFAQTDFESMPKNTVTVDVGPTIFGLTFGQIGKLAGNFVEGLPDINSSGFGIGAQYERQVLRQLGVAARAAYLGVGLNMGDNRTQSGFSIDSSIEMDLTAISAEGHVRFYPFGSTFFLGGMAGYGNLIMVASGEVKVSEQNTGLGGKQPFSLNEPRSYVKLGARVGWRIDFGRPGGFVFEPSFGYDHAIGLGDSFGKRLQNVVTGGNLVDLDKLDEAFKLLENYVLVGGPRVSLAFGLRF